MRSIKALVIAISVMALLAVGSTAFAKTQTSDLTANVIIVDLVTAVATTDIEFGSLAFNGTGFAVLDSSTGFATAITFLDTALQSTGSAADVGSVIVAGSSGSVTITAGSPGSITSIAYPDLTLATGNPGETIALTNIADNSQPITSLTTGSNVFYLGAGIVASAAQVSGTYTATGTVTVTY